MFILSGPSHKPNRYFICNPPTKSFNEFRFESKQTLPIQKIFIQEEKGLLVSLQSHPFQNKLPHLNTRIILKAVWPNLCKRKNILEGERGEIT